MNMTHEIIKLVLAAIAMVYFIVQISLIPVWRNKVSARIGDCVFKTAPAKKGKAVTVLVLCPLLILFSLISKSTFFVCCLMSVVAAMACFITSREMVYGKLNGVYTKGIAGSGRFISFEEIETFPDTSWKEPEKQNTVSLAIQLKQTKSQKASIIFVDCESVIEYVKVINAIKDLKQNK